jgi:hypothetical protein
MLQFGMLIRKGSLINNKGVVMNTRGSSNNSIKI